MLVSNAGLARVAAFEACVLTVYADVHSPAIGFGQNDPALKEGDTITLEEAIGLFVKNAMVYEAAVNRLFADVALSQTQFDALFSLAYNIGGGNLRKERTLVDAVKAFAALPGDHVLRDKAGFAIIRAHWSEENGGPFNFSRRCREALLFVAGDYGDISTLKLWGPGLNPRTSQPALVAMPVFRAA